MHMKAKSGKHPKQLGSAIFHAVLEHGRVEIDSVGAGAVNTCNKALIVAKERLAEKDVQVSLHPSFVQVETKDQGPIVAIRWVIEKIA